MPKTEPKELEKSALSTITREINRLVADKERLADEICIFVDSSNFTIVPSLRHPFRRSVQFSGPDVLQLAVGHAVNAAGIFSQTFKLYLDEIPGFDPDIRSQILSGHIMDAEQFKDERKMEYDEMPDNARALMHIHQAFGFAETNIQTGFINGVFSELPPDLGDQMFRDRGIYVPLEENPELVGFLYIQMNAYEIIRSHQAKFEGLDPEQSAERNRENREAFLNRMSPDAPDWGGKMKRGSPLRTHHN